MKPQIKIIHDTRRTKVSGKYPLKLRVTFLRQQKYYPVRIDLTAMEFELVQNPGSIPKQTDTATKRQIKEWKLTCDAIELKATDIIDRMEEFSFRLFEKRLFYNQQSAQDVYQWYTGTIKKMRSAGKVGTASNYQSSMQSLKVFSPKLNFRDITVEFLKEYEKGLLSEGKSITTVGIYLRPLRAILNEAIAEGIISRENHYPFGKRMYQIPSGKNIKKALSLDEISKLFHYKAIPGTWREKARDFFILSYLGNGINMKDIALLQYQNIDGDFIRFNRSKTQNTNRTGSRPISIYISEDIKSIIERQKTPTAQSEDFLFDILQPNLTPDRERSLIQQFTKMVNRYIKLIAHDVGVNKPVTTYYARHSFATILRRSGASTELISESLGHSNIKTTASYLDSFDDDTKKELQTKLMNF
ncbi:MAG: site-specific integrase [Sediminibacterium sp.]|nr:site-specific integrase [Sediminibacterium sp.]